MYHISISSKCFLKNTQENFFNKRRRRWALLEPNCYLKCDSRFEFGAISSPSRARNNKIKCNSTHKIGEWRVSGCGGGEALSSIRLEKFVFWVRALLSRFQAWHASSMVQHERQQSKEKVPSKVPSKMFFFRAPSPYLMFIYSRHVCGGKAEIPLKKPRYNKSFSVMAT